MRRFLDRLRTEHAAFRARVAGIPDPARRDWYATLVLSRVMFLYFLQQKGFPDGDPAHLQRALRAVQRQAGLPGAGARSFYRDVLLPLFQRGAGGGLFGVHPAERDHPGIDIPDGAFARLFDCLDGYRWRLGGGPPAAEGEVTPDVLGCLLEQFVNQRELGAYYTGADVTGYMARHCIVPHLLDAIAARHPAGAGAIWDLCRRDPDRYLPPALRHGGGGPLPEPIAAGVADPARRRSWNGPAAAGLALHPTETWRECAARGHRLIALRARLTAGQVRTAGDLITHNLDGPRLLADAVAAAGRPLLQAVYAALSQLTVLDPTCGAGAFLLAALDVLAPLYAAVLDRMEALAPDLLPAGADSGPGRAQFIVRRIIGNHLYGVDIMPEAAELCRLGLILRLAACVGTAAELEPLPDLDRHIRAGNVLDGAGAPAECPAAMAAGGFSVIVGNPPYVEWSRVDAYDVPEGRYQTRPCGNVYAAVCERAYELLAPGGRSGMIVPLSCVATGRMAPLRAAWARFGLTTHASHYSGDAHPSVLFDGVKFRLTVLLQHKPAATPAGGADGADGSPAGAGAGLPPALYTTHFQRWLPAERDTLFQLVEYVPVPAGAIRRTLVPKMAHALHAGVLDRLLAHPDRLGRWVQRDAGHAVYVHRIVAHFVKAVDFVPYFSSQRDGRKRSEDYKAFATGSPLHRDVICALLNSSLFYCWFVTYSDVYHCGRELVLDFPANVDDLARTHGAALGRLNRRLMADLRQHSVRRRIPYRTTGLVEYDEFYPRKSKPIMDEIDAVLADCYSLTPEELDFVVNFDVKFRMGLFTAGASESAGRAY